MPAEDQRAAEGDDRPPVVAQGAAVPRRRGAGRRTSRCRSERDDAGDEADPPARNWPCRSTTATSAPPRRRSCCCAATRTRRATRSSPASPRCSASPTRRSRRRPGAKTSGRRTVLADWIASKDNPLTARVMVNRVWQYHFGRGHRPLAEQLRQLGRPADASRAARLAGRRVRRRRLAAQARCTG